MNKKLYEVIAAVPNSEAKKGMTLYPHICGNTTAWFVKGQTTGGFSRPWLYPANFKLKSK